MGKCEYDEDGECAGYGHIACPHQNVEYNYRDYQPGHAEINIIKCDAHTDADNDCA